ncbi:MAG TPA: YhjD/YihY/BrkB family envelope integrity protein [Nocardioidaceae bacterium]|nr:YhjD/YihY/BrkB family envelope integrity protein [Nocardioidaceae bacterium]
MSITERLDRVQRRRPVLGFPLAIFYKFFDDMGTYLAVLLAYYALVAIVPLLLLASTILGVVLVGHPHLQEQLLSSALGRVPVIGDQLRVPGSFSGGIGAVLVGVLGSMYGSLGVANSLQYAGNTIWHIPRNSRPNPFLARGRSLLLVATAGVGMLVVVVGIAMLHALMRETVLSNVLIDIAGVIVATLVLLVAFQLAQNKTVPWGKLLPGALLASLGLQALQNASYVYVDHVIGRASTTNAIFAAVLGLLAYLFLAALVVVFSMELNAVYAEQLWPRALLTPFTDNVDLTAADEDAYTGQARAQRIKGFEQIEVRFHGRPPLEEPEDLG